MQALASKRVEWPVGCNETKQESTKRSFADGNFVEVGPFQSVRVKLIQVFPVSLRDIYLFCEILDDKWAGGARLQHAADRRQNLLRASIKVLVLISEIIAHHIIHLHSTLTVTDSPSKEVETACSGNQTGGPARSWGLAVHHWLGEISPRAVDDVVPVQVVEGITCSAAFQWWLVTSIQHCWYLVLAKIWNQLDILVLYSLLLLLLLILLCGDIKCQKPMYYYIWSANKSSAGEPSHFSHEMKNWPVRSIPPKTKRLLPAAANPWFVRFGGVGIAGFW